MNHTCSNGKILLKKNSIFSQFEIQLKMNLQASPMRIKKKLNSLFQDQSDTRKNQLPGTISNKQNQYLGTVKIRLPLHVA